MTTEGLTTTIPVSQRSLVPGDTSPTPWDEACAHLARGDTFWLATVRPDGRPHTMPLLAVWVDDTLHFAAGADTKKARNLAWNAHCVVTVRSGGFDLVVEGRATKVCDADRLRRVANAYATKYGWRVSVRDSALHDADGAPSAGPPPYDVYAVAPSTAFAFGSGDETVGVATRWRFPQQGSLSIRR